MPITQEQREQRRRFIGSSDAAAILGLDPYKTAADIYLSKVHILEEEQNPSDAVIVGNALEHAILDWATDELGFKIKKGITHIHPNGIMAANPDGEAIDRHELIECKTAGITNRFADIEEWGEIETDQIPEKYFIQCQHQLAVAGEQFKIVHVPVLLAGVGLRMYHVERDQGLIEIIEAREVYFWKEFIEKRNPPNGDILNSDVVKRIKRTPNKTVQIDSQLIANWNEAKEVLNQAKKKEELAKNILLASLGDAEAAESDLGIITYFEQKRKAYEVKESSYRVLRFKTIGGKNGK